MAWHHLDAIQKIRWYNWNLVMHPYNLLGLCVAPIDFHEQRDLFLSFSSSTNDDDGGGGGDGGGSNSSSDVDVDFSSSAFFSRFVLFQIHHYTTAKLQRLNGARTHTQTENSHHHHHHHHLRRTRGKRWTYMCSDRYCLHLIRMVIGWYFIAVARARVHSMRYDVSQHTLKSCFRTYIYIYVFGQYNNYERDGTRAMIWRLVISIHTNTRVRGPLCVRSFFFLSRCLI